MARIAGVDIPRDRRVEASLPVIYGIGPTTTRRILARTNINPDTRVRDLTEEEISRIREVIDREYTVEGDLRREVNLNIKLSSFGVGRLRLDVGRGSSLVQRLTSNVELA